MGEVEVPAVLWALASGDWSDGRTHLSRRISASRPAQLITAKHKHLFKEQKFAPSILEIRAICFSYPENGSRVSIYVRGYKWQQTKSYASYPS